MDEDIKSFPGVDVACAGDSNEPVDGGAGAADWVVRGAGDAIGTIIL